MTSDNLQRPLTTRTSPNKRSNKTYISLQRNPICGFAFLGADEVGVDLGGFDALVGEHLGDRIYVCAECDLECGKGMAEAVESKW